MKRHSDALAIQSGACNPLAISRALVSACDEVRDKGTDAILNDPAVRLIVHQLACLCKANDSDLGGLEYYKLTEACEQAS